jgi:hypothetical protein
MSKGIQGYEDQPDLLQRQMPTGGLSKEQKAQFKVAP